MNFVSFGIDPKFLRQALGWLLGSPDRLPIEQMSVINVLINEAHYGHCT